MSMSDWLWIFRRWMRVPTPASASRAHPCPCCGCLTIQEPGEYDLCPVCFWEDDPSQSSDPKFAGGANGYALESGRLSYRAIGASSRSFLGNVRKPLPSELPQ